MSILITERMTRDFSREMGVLQLDVSACLSLAGDEQAVIVARCSRSRLIRKMATVAKNALPIKTVICCHSYEDVSDCASTLSSFEVKVWSILGDGLVNREVSNAAVVVTVPEKLYALTPHCGVGAFLPNLIFVSDPGARMFDVRSETFGGGTRVSNVGAFRAAMLARGIQVAPVVWTAVTPQEIQHSRMCNGLSVESAIYLDGGRCRTELGEVGMPQDQVN